ncbi:hypothetical protein PF005_g28792 [Phytophthora fragariae]|uniref:Uncharacterized protein n=1 Tax=Phytophthora fragariae TaxID=53985 RepID=A0A6A3IYS3_9STRA|nr:hypothetical protein PF009_g26976 [Phytophthora fragariae]KAE8988176.1 hypothetical protein PF011_g19271 [Phytophthora fragariae]KAE9080841.1 hypothetical protein PF006_g27239 [Phytophthora fragariae]KAE9097750.1 hypothetical protein PF010_g15836 [Phytophthora fragariae]KAE9167408.1 hypothetical protein PF005_g28792 [Phytophthora fragariae]
MAQRERRLCYVHLVVGCARCQDRPRPTSEEWERQVMSWTLSEDERRWLGRYVRARRDFEVAASRGSGRRETRERARSRSRSRSPGHVRWRRSRSRSPARARPRSRSRDRVRLQEGGYGFPRILRRRVSMPAHPIVLLGCLPSSGARIRSTRGTARGTLAVGASIVINQALQDVSPRPRCIHKRRRPITLVPSLLQRRLAPSGPTPRRT